MKNRFDGPYKIVPMEQYDCMQGDLTLTVQIDENDIQKDVVVFKCPCGCNGIHCLPINGFKAENGAGWSFSETDGKPTITPSVFAGKTCGAHFFLKDGLIEWCPPF